MYEYLLDISKYIYIYIYGMTGTMSDSIKMYEYGKT